MKLISVIIVAITSLLVCKDVLAQITIMSSSLAGIGTVVHKRSSTERVPVDPGSAGENQIWGIRNYECPDNYVQEFIDPTTTDFQSTFPASTICERQTYSDNTQFDLYRRLEVSQYLGLGSVVTQPGFDPLVAIYDSAYNVTDLPLSYGSPPINGVYSYQMVFAPGDTFSVWNSTTTVVDAWGTLVTDSTSYEVLRLFQQVWAVTWFTGESPDTITYSYYIWKDVHGITVGSFSYLGLDAIGDAGVTVSDNVNFVPVSRHPDIVKSFSLLQNYPNPFNSSTQIQYYLPQLANVSVRVFDVLGREVATLVNGEMQSLGQHAVNWNGHNNAGIGVATGTYIYQIEAGEFRDEKKMVLVK